MSATILWRTTSRRLKCTNVMSSTPPSTGSRPISPERPPGTSICVTSPVTTHLEPNPMRVRNIFICSGVVFWASSRMMNELLSVRRHLDGPTIEQALRALGLEQVVEGVVERAEIGIDLGHEVARQEAEPLAR